MTPEEPTPDNDERLDEEAFWRKLRSVPRGVVERALTLYVLLSSRDTPAWVRALVLAALAYLINPLDACPDVLPGIGLTDDLAVLALALERLSRYVTPEVEARAKRLVPRWLAGGENQTRKRTRPAEIRANTNKETMTMPRKKETKEEAASASSTEETGPMVTVLKEAQAPKLSPRGDGQLTYQVGRMEDTVLLRISGNESSGRFSKEWVTAEAIRKSLAQLPKGVKSFKGALALKSAWNGRSSCNSGFGAAILKAEGVFAADEDPKKKGMLTLSAPDALDAWEKNVLAMKIPKDAEQVPLHPPKPKPFFAKKDDTEDGEATEAPEETEGAESPEEAEA